MPPRAPQVKGLGIIGLLNSIEKLLGSATHRAVLEQMRGELAERARARTVLAAGWYPLDEYCQLHAAAQRITGRGPELARELSRHAVSQDFRGIYRILTSVLSPQFLVKRSPGLFGRYFDTGKLEVPEARKGFARAVFSGCAGFDHSVWEDSIGGTIAILEACGAADLQVEVISGGLDGDQHLDVSASWS